VARLRSLFGPARRLWSGFLRRGARSAQPVTAALPCGNCDFGWERNTKEAEETAKDAEEKTERPFLRFLYSFCVFCVQDLTGDYAAKRSFDQPSARRSSAQSNCDPGSCLRPGAMCSWPATWAMG
jgi:hypothetical protein